MIDNAILPGESVENLETLCDLSVRLGEHQPVPTETHPETNELSGRVIHSLSVYFRQDLIDETDGVFAYQMKQDKPNLLEP